MEGRKLEGGGEQERAREQWVQKATEAWNAAENAFKVARPQGREAADEAFASTWRAKCQELRLGALNLQWWKGMFGSMPFGESHYLFVHSTATFTPTVNSAFDISPTAQEGNVRVKRPASMKSDIYAAINGDLTRADEHEFEKGQLV